MANITALAAEGTERQPLKTFTEKAYLDYSMYVILDRALPHIGDASILTTTHSRSGVGSGTCSIQAFPFCKASVFMMHPPEIDLPDWPAKPGQVPS